MKLLLHICCGPCLIFPYQVLNARGVKIGGLFYNPNIHPYSEYAKRQEALQQYASDIKLNVVYSEEYPMETFLRNVASREDERCRYCYDHRLRYAAALARDHHYEAFSTTLLYSKYQKHDMIREIAENVASDCGIQFYYEDFRTGWKEGIETSKRLGMYRQQYCGCIYSEKERFFRPSSGMSKL